MLYQNLISLFITLFLFSPVFVQGELLTELRRKFLQFFKLSPKQRPGPFYGGCNLCLFGPCTPMVWPSNDDSFDGSVLADKIMANSIPPKGEYNLTPEQKYTFAATLTDISALQRTAVAEAFEEKYNKLIIDQLRTRISNYYRFTWFIRALSLPLPKFFQIQFEYAFTSLQKKDKKMHQDIGIATIIEILTTLPQCLMNEVIELYDSNPGGDLSARLDKSLTEFGKPPAYRKVIKKLVEQRRDTNQHASWIEALKYSYKLKSVLTSQRKYEVKETFSELFTKFSFPQIIETIVVYENLRQGDKEFQSLFDEIDKYKGEEKEIYKFMVRILKNKSLYYAKAFEEIFKSGIKNNELEERVINLIVGRYDIDLKNIIDAYNQQSETGFRVDFEAWDTSTWAESFHEIVLDIIKKATSMPA